MERKRIGIIFNFSTGWLGGIIYILNIVKTLNFLEDEDKPEIFLFYNDATSRFLNEINYPHLTLIRWKFQPIIQGYFSSFLSGRNKFIERMILDYELDAIYPVFNHPVKDRRLSNNTKVISWFADLQHKYYPAFFSRKQLFMRELRLRFMLRNTTNLVVSSQSVADDFKKFYRLKASLQMSIYHFTSIIDDFNFVSKEKLMAQYNLPEAFYLVSNQFHNHKNHKVVLQAVGKLKDEGVEVYVAMTGKFPKKQSSAYITELYDLIDHYQLKNNIVFLGVLSRHEQLSLMHHCQAVIQPSLFEGWSTVIEDSISIQTPVIASNLDVNIEQLSEKAIYFSPLESDELVEIIRNYPIRTDYSKVIYEDYETRVRRGAKTLMKILTSKTN